MNVDVRRSEVALGRRGGVLTLGPATGDVELPSEARNRRAERVERLAGARKLGIERDAAGRLPTFATARSTIELLEDAGLTTAEAEAELRRTRAARTRPAQRASRPRWR